MHSNSTRGVCPERFERTEGDVYLASSDLWSYLPEFEQAAFDGDSRSVDEAIADYKRRLAF